METKGRRATRSRLLGAAVLASVAVAATACGGGGTAPKESATVQWANGVCTAFTDWKASLREIRSGLESGTPSSSDLRQAGRQANDATQKLARSLQKLGKPDTAAGAAAQSSLEQLAKQLEDGVAAIQDAAANASGVAGALGAASTVTATASTLADDVSSTVAELRQLDAKGELGKAFHEADSCAPLFG